jgi:membrane associated rhomboid family serine protease
MGDWSAFRLIATFTILFLAIELVLGPLFRRGPTPLFEYMALRAWWIDRTGELSFNVLFPLQLFTYMLQHSPSDLSHIFWNLLYLYFFGRELEALLGKAAFLRLYVLGGMLGGLAQWTVGFLGDDPLPIVGASGAVYALMTLYVLKWPTRVIYMIFPPFPIPIVVLAVIRLLGDISGAMTGGEGTAHFAHLGGALFGLLWWRGGDVLGRLSLQVRRSKAVKKAQKEDPDRREMDRILGKIQAEGLASLTPQERGYLDRRSKELREQRR